MDFSFAGGPILPRLQPIDRQWEFTNSITCYGKPQEAGTRPNPEGRPGGMSLDVNAAGVFK